MTFVDVRCSSTGRNWTMDGRRSCFTAGNTVCFMYCDTPTDGSARIVPYDRNRWAAIFNFSTNLHRNKSHDTEIKQGQHEYICCAAVSQGQPRKSDTAVMRQCAVDCIPIRDGGKDESRGTEVNGDEDESMKKNHKKNEQLLLENSTVQLVRGVDFSCVYTSTGHLIAVTFLYPCFTIGTHQCFSWHCN